jgi:sec-independent protein translocase protein TatC
MASKEKTKNTLVQNLLEIRNKLLKSVIAIAIIFLAIFPFANDIYTFIAAPIINVLPVDANIIAIGVISPFSIPLKMALIFAVYLAMPYLLYQGWSFIAPALYKHEKRLITPLIISSTILFYTGLLFAFYIVFPVIFGFLSTVGPSIVSFAPDIKNYLDFVLKVSFAFAVAFEVPIATILLIMFGVVSREKLKKNRSYVILGAFVLGMLLTPPDIISQFLIAIPMWLLFEAGLFFSPLFKVRHTDKDQQNQRRKDKGFDWSDESHNTKMNKLEAKMNKRGMGK